MKYNDIPSNYALLGQKRRRIGEKSVMINLQINPTVNQQYYFEEKHHTNTMAHSSTFQLPRLYKGNKKRRSFPLSEKISAPYNKRASFTVLPDELVFFIISFVGPTSSTLLNLAQLTKYHSNLMNIIGDTMLIRAKSQFRTLLHQSHLHESSISSFVKHARFCSDMREKMQRLEKILEKDFVVDSCLLSSAVGYNDSVSLPLIHCRRRICINGGGVRLGGTMINEQVEERSIMGGNDNNIVTTYEVDLAIELVMSLLGPVSTTSHHGRIPDGHNYSQVTSSCGMRRDQTNSLRHVSAELESRVLALCGKCGGKVFKYAKMRLWLRNVGVALASDRQDITSSRFVRELIIREGNKLRLPRVQSVSSTGQNETTDREYSIIPEYEKSKDEERMHNARLVMKSVICRDLELSTKNTAE